MSRRRSWITGLGLCQVASVALVTACADGSNAVEERAAAVEAGAVLVGDDGQSPAKGSAGETSSFTDAAPEQSTCGHDPDPADTDIGQFDFDRWIGVKADPVTCGYYGDAQWTVTPLFNAPAGATLPAGLERYCLAVPTAPGLTPSALSKVSKLNDLAQDRPVFALQGELAEAVFPVMRDRFQERSGYLAAPDALISGSVAGNVDLVVLDTMPYAQLGAPRSPHGISLAGMARELTCGTQEDCARTVSTELAMGHFYGQEGDPGFSEANPLEPLYDADAGGAFGTQGELAVAVVNAMMRQQVAVASKGPRRTILNMSLGWDPAMFGDIPSNLQSAAAQVALLNNSDTNTSVSGPVRAVHAALVQASCDGALSLAATGNAVPGVCDEGPLLPARFNDFTRLDAARCEQVGLASPGLHSKKFPLHSGKKGQPLVYGVGATDWDGETATFQRAAAVPLLNAQGFKGAAYVDAQGSPSGILTGTSVSTVVASAAAALAWSHFDHLPATELVSHMASGLGDIAQQGGVGGVPVDYGLGLPGAGTLGKEVTVCGALAATAQSLESGVQVACPAMPSSADPDLGGILSGAVASAGLSLASETSATLGAADCVNGCGEEYVYNQTADVASQSSSTMHGNFVMPQPHSNLCPACNINGGGTGGGSGDSNNSSNGVLVVQFDEAFHQLTPGGVTIIRTGAGTTVVHELGDIGLSPDGVTEVVSEDLAYDPLLDEATIVVEFEDANGVTFNAYDVITVTE